MVVKFSKEVSGFIESYGAKTSDEWYWFPMYFKKTGENLFEMFVFKDLPDSLKHIVEQSEPREPKEKEQMSDKKVICECGAEILDDDIEFHNGNNEEGEDYHTVDATCHVCKREYSFSGWGEVGLDDAKETLIEHIKE